jgi:uncharacterized protein (DUF2062 family)
VKTAASRFSASVAGLSPESIALLLTVGLVLGVFPVFLCPTILCALAAAIFRLNLPAIQLINQLSSPLQLVLLIPLNRLGARVLGGSAGWSLAGATRDAIAGWFCLCVPLGLGIYFVLLYTLRRCREGWFNGLESPG